MSAPLSVNPRVPTLLKSQDFKPFAALPKELLKFIFSFLSTQELVRATRVCKGWRQEINQLSFFRLLHSIGGKKETFSTQESFTAVEAQKDILCFQENGGLKIYSISQRCFTFFWANAQILRQTEKYLFVTTPDRTLFKGIDPTSEKVFFTLDLGDERMKDCWVLSEKNVLKLVTLTQAGVLSLWKKENDASEMICEEKWNLVEFHEDVFSHYEVEEAYFCQRRLVVLVKVTDKRPREYPTYHTSFSYSLDTKSVERFAVRVLQNKSVPNYLKHDVVQNRLYNYDYEGDVIPMKFNVQCVDIEANSKLWEKCVARTWKKRVCLNENYLIFFEDKVNDGQIPGQNEVCIVTPEGNTVATFAIAVREGQTFFFKIIANTLLIFIDNLLLFKNMQGESIGKREGYVLDLKAPVKECFLTEKELAIVTSNANEYEISLFETKLREFSLPSPQAQPLIPTSVKITALVFAIIALLYMSGALAAYYRGSINLSIAMGVLSGISFLGVLGVAIDRIHRL